MKRGRDGQLAGSSLGAWDLLQHLIKDRFSGKGLCLSVRFDQHVVGDGFVSEADGEESGKAGMSVAASIESKDELVEIGLEMGAA